MNTAPFHFDILPDNQKKLWPHLKATVDMGFILYGGTAIALQLGHRVSVDFDFFSSESLDERKVTELLQAIPVLAESQETYREPNTRYYETATGVKVSFFGGIGFVKKGFPAIISPDAVLKMAPLQNLLATKLKVLMDRVEAKDYQDIAAMCQAGLDLTEGLLLAKDFFGNFPLMDCLKATTWFRDGDLQKLSEHDRAVLIQAAQGVDIKALI